MSEVITGRGYNTADLISLLTLIRTNFVGVTAKLDADSGVSGTDYGSLWNFALPDSAQLQLLGIRDQGVLLNYLKTIRTGLAGVLAKLDLDAGVADTDYASTLGISAVIDSGSNASDLNQNGLYEGATVKWLGNYIAKWNALLTKLDNDGTVNGTNYNSLWAISAALVDTTGCTLKV